jgi:hypothetical protein
VHHLGLDLDKVEDKYKNTSGVPSLSFDFTAEGRLQTHGFDIDVMLAIYMYIYIYIWGWVGARPPPQQWTNVSAWHEDVTKDGTVLHMMVVDKSIYAYCMKSRNEFLEME